MGKFIDLTGRSFGRWTVLRRAEVPGPFIHWLCRCACGAHRDVSGASLRRGLSTSCGCYKAETTSTRKLNDLSGRRFGLLHVVRRAENSPHGDAQWLCECDCGGAAVVVRSCNLVSGNTGSCGCAKLAGIVVSPEERRAVKRAKANKRYRSDVKFNINARMANAIRISLRRKGRQRKAGRWSELVGYGVDELRARLEATLPPNLTWIDYLAGKLEIDHITPLAAFNYESVTDLDFQKAWALSNLRLIPARDNLLKSDKLSDPFQPSLRF